MKTWRDIFTNPIAIAVAVVHWIVILVAIYGQEHSQPFHFIYEPPLTQWLYLLNFLPMIFVGIILQPVVAFFGQNPFVSGFCLFLNFLTITFQWLIIGYIIAGFIDSIKHKGLKISLNDK